MKKYLVLCGPTIPFWVKVLITVILLAVGLLLELILGDTQDLSKDFSSLVHPPKSKSMLLKTLSET